MSETALLKHLMLRWSQSGMRLFRNNIGTLRDARGGYVTYGVANPGGSDLIGWTPIIVTEAMVGRTVAVFTAIECKAGNRYATPEQLAFLRALDKDGGIGCVTRSDDDVAEALARFTA